MRNSHTDTKTS